MDKSSPKGMTLPRSAGGARARSLTLSTYFHRAIRVRMTVRSMRVAILLLPVLLIMACGSNGRHSAGTQPPPATSTTCSDGAKVHGAFASHRVASGSTPIQVATDSWVEVAVSETDTVIAAGRSSGWNSLGTETPATIVRVNGVTGQILERVTLSAADVGVHTTPKPTSSPALPVWDTIQEAAVGVSTVYLVWTRVVDGEGQDQTLVALDSCRLKIISTRTLPAGGIPQQANQIAYDHSANSVWVLSSAAVGSYNARTLGVGVSVPMSNTSQGCLADANSALWYSASALQRIDPTMGTATAIPGVEAESGSCVLSDGEHLMLSLDGQLLELDPHTGEVMGRQVLPAVVQIGRANEMIWAAGAGSGGGGAVTPFSVGATPGTPVTTSFEILCATTTPENVWLVDFSGRLFVLE